MNAQAPAVSLRDVTVAYDAAPAALERLGMSRFERQQISELSGGQQQRVFLARALVQEARLYLMDEPLQGVDAATESAILDLMHELTSEGRTLVVVHHDLQRVREYFSWVAMLNLELVAAGPVDSCFTDEIVERTYGAPAGARRPRWAG